VSETAQIVQIVLFILFAIAAVVLSIAIRYIFNLRALDRGFGKGRDAGDWALRGMTGAAPYSVLNPQGTAPKRGKSGESTVCPKCGVERRLHEGFCTVCGTNVIEALIAEAKREERAEHSNDGENAKRPNSE